MKKLALLMLVLMLALGMLVACDGEGGDVTTDPSVTTAPAGTTTPAGTTAPVTTVAEEPVLSPLETFFKQFSEKGTATVTVDLTELGYVKEGETAKVVISLGADTEQGLGLATFNVLWGEIETGDLLIYVKGDAAYLDLSALEGGVYKMNLGISEEDLLESDFFQMMDAMAEGRLTSVMEAADLFTEEDLTTALAFVEEYVTLLVTNMNLPDAPDPVPGTITIAGVEMNADKASFRITAATLANSLKATLAVAKADADLGAFVAATYDKVMAIMQDMMPAPAPTEAEPEAPTAGEAYWTELCKKIDALIAEKGMLNAMAVAYPADKYYLEVTDWSVGGLPVASTLTVHVDHNDQELVFLPELEESYQSTAFERQGIHYSALLHGDYWFIREKNDKENSEARWYKIAKTTVDADPTKLEDKNAWTDVNFQPEGLFDTATVNHLLDVVLTVHPAGMMLDVDYAMSCTEYPEESRYNGGTNFTQDIRFAAKEDGATLTIETVVDEEETQTIEIDFTEKENGVTLTIEVDMDMKGENDDELYTIVLDFAAKENGATLTIEVDMDMAGTENDEVKAIVLDFTVTDTDAATTYLFTIEYTSSLLDSAIADLSLEAVYTKATGEFKLTGTNAGMGTFELFGKQELTETKLSISVNKFVLTGEAVEGAPAPEPIVYEFDVSVVLENTLGTIPEGTDASDVLTMNEEALGAFMEEIMGIVSQFMPEPQPEVTPGA